MESDLYYKIGQQIKRARENLGMSQDELSKKLGYSSPASISHFESGLRKISLFDLQKISDILGCSLDYLISSSSSKHHMQQFYLRAADVTPSARQEVAEFLSFVHNNGGKPTFSIDAKDLTPNKAAEKLLDTVKISFPPVSPTDVAEQLGIHVFEWDFPNEISGMYAIEGGRVGIGVNQNHPNVRQRFTVAHELGHFIYHDDNNLFLDFIETNIPTHVYDKDKQQLETQANQFAANLLMPKDFVKKDFNQYGQSSLLQLARKYDVSEQAMWFRLINLGLVRNN